MRPAAADMKKGLADFFITVAKILYSFSQHRNKTVKLLGINVNSAAKIFFKAVETYFGNDPDIYILEDCKIIKLHTVSIKRV